MRAMAFTLIAISSIGLIATSVVSQHPAGEQITRDEIIDAALGQVHFKCLPGTEQAAQRDALLTMLSSEARAADFIPARIDGLPHGTRDRILQNRLEILSQDPIYCKTVLRAHLLAQVASAHIARLMPRLSAEEQRRLNAELEGVFERVGASISKHAGAHVTSEEIAGWITNLRAYVKEQMSDPTTLYFKRPLDPKTAAEICADFDLRLADAAERIDEEARTLASAKPDASGRDPHRTFLAWLRGQTIEPVRYRLAKATSLDEQPLRARLEERFPGYYRTQAEAAALNMKLIREASDRRNAAFRLRAEQQRAEFSRRYQRLQEPSALPADH